VNESLNTGKWEKMTFGYTDFARLGIDSDGGWLRTPHLTKEQIEADGWQYNEDSFLKSIGKFPNHFWFTKNGFGLTFYPDKYTIDIDDDRVCMANPVMVYRGSCQDINTFRTICKLLNIK
jgi:hypothetical protein